MIALWKWQSANNVLCNIVNKCNAHTADLMYQSISTLVQKGIVDGNGKTTGVEAIIYSDK